MYFARTYMSISTTGSAWNTGTNLLYADPTPAAPERKPVGRVQGPSLPPVHTCVEAPRERTFVQSWERPQSEWGYGSCYDRDGLQDRWDSLWGHS